MQGGGRAGLQAGLQAPRQAFSPLSRWPNARAPELATAKPRGIFTLSHTRCVTLSRSLTSLSLCSLSEHHLLSLEMEWCVWEQAVNCKEAN